jgi:CDP-diacylglycerol---glycerol-3-phosphate 3-phosphatidyltransferase
MSISVYQLKPVFQRLLRPLVEALARSGVSPNQLTVLTMLGMIGWGLLMAGWPQQAWVWLALPGVMLVRMALNALDGLLATHTGQTTRLGTMLNEVCDVVSDAALALPFLLAPGVHGTLMVLVVVLSAVVEFAGLSALAAGAPRRFDGPMGKSDRAVVLGLLGLLVGLGAPPLWMTVLLGLTLTLLLLTVFNRLQAALSCADGR